MIHLYNTLTKEKELFTPITQGKVGMYHCGPTVYGYIHIGNLRSFLLGDLLRRTFEYSGYTTLQVMNITDVGHLVSDGDDGEDKMTKGLKREGLEITVENMLKLADRYGNAFKDDLTALNILTPHVIPKASDHIQEDLVIITELEKKGFTYTTSDGVYFDTSKMPDYGKLGGLDLEGEHVSRLGENSEKKNNADFALWKFDSKMGWESPWGLGFPGWHIECSGMSMKYLGARFDIHTGGLDNRDVHHNNEIAQSESMTGEPFVNYWLHGEMLNFGGAKLSKSTGGNITLQTLSEKGFSPLSYRYLALQTHYRSQLAFSWEALEAGQNGLEKVYRQVSELKKQALEKQGVPDPTFKKLFMEKISDDIGIPQALALMHEVLKSDLSPEKKLATLFDFDSVLGLGLEKFSEETNNTPLPKEILELMEERETARKNKDWELADSLREKIVNLGFKVEDKKD